MSHHTAGCVAATAAVSFAASAAVYSYAVHPGGLEAGPKAYTAFFAKMFPKIARFQSALVLVGTGAAVVQARRTSDQDTRALWLGSGALLASVIPWTVFKMMPVNNTIISAAEQGKEASMQTLEAWGPLHAYRTAAGVLTVAVMVFALSRRK